MIQRLRNWLIGHLVMASVPEDVLALKDGKIVLGKTAKWMVGGKELTPELETQLAMEAHYIKNTRLWEIMTGTLKRDSDERICDRATSFNDVWFGKAMKYNLQVMGNILEAASKLSKKQVQ